MVISDLHLGSGVRPGETNPFEDFHYDDVFEEWLKHHSLQKQDSLRAHKEVELILNGDIFDLLKIMIDGVWPTEITEEVACNKLKQCLDGHPRFVSALKAFIANEKHRIVYLPGNHDLDMVFENAQKLLRSYICEDEDSERRVVFITSTDAYSLPEGIQIRHGHQLEHVHKVNYKSLFQTHKDGKVTLKLPWGSLWILEVMNPAKAISSYVDRVQPQNRFLAAALILDTRFFLRFVWSTMLYFLRKRVFSLGAWMKGLRELPQRLSEEIFSLASFDDLAIKWIHKTRGVQYLIVGHSHGPRYSRVGSKVMVNTGTWMKMINLDLRNLGQDTGFTYALITYDDSGKPRVELLRWKGLSKPYETIHYAD